jgi:hypothetical protein
MQLNCIRAKAKRSINNGIKEKMVVIESPLDSLWKQGGIDWDG